jgi:signal transduction histidine kinase
LEPSPDASLPAESTLHRFLDRTLFQFEAATLVALLLITFVQPTAGRSGIPTWGLVLGYLGYSLVVELIRNRIPQLHAFLHKYVLNLLVSAFVYFLGASPGGALFVLFFLDVACATVSLTLRGSLRYTAAAITLMSVIDPTFPTWSLAHGGIQDTGVRAVMLALFGVGTAILRGRLQMEHEAAEAVRSAAERLEELDHVRSEFIETVSHELQTPLTAARAALVLLQTSTAERLQRDEQGLLDNARRNVERLGLLINDLLAHNQLEAGTLRLDREPSDLRAVVMDALSTVSPLVREKGQQLEVDLPQPLPAFVDAQQMEHVLVNLLANAHRHTPAGSRIAITGRVENRIVLLSVCDNGPGIPAEELEGIFRRFHRLGTSENGSGLGLAICRAVVELHGGRIWAESAPGAGTTFFVALPHTSSEGRL